MVFKNDFYVPNFYVLNFWVFLHERFIPYGKSTKGQVLIIPIGKDIGGWVYLKVQFSFKTELFFHEGI